MSSTIDNFNGSVHWKGFSEKTNLEFNGPGPLLRRRIVFTTAHPLAGTDLVRIPSGVGNNYGRFPLCRVTDEVHSETLSAMFMDTSITGLTMGQLKKEWVEVLEDKRDDYRGVDGGCRKLCKYYNSIERSIRYDPGGIAGSSAVLSAPYSVTKNVYVMDILHFGVACPDGPVRVVKTEKGSSKSGYGARMTVDELDDDVTFVRMSSEISVYYYGSGKS